MTLLSADGPEEALLGYYAFFHPRPLTRVRRLNSRRGSGLLVVADPGFDGARLVTLTASSASAARCLLYGSLVPGDRYYFVSSLRSSRWWRPLVHHRREETVSVISVTDRSRFRPFSTPGIVPERYEATRASGLLRYFGYRCLHQGEPVSHAFVIWQSERYAEIGVFTRDDFRGRGYARAVVSALTQELLARGITPLYVYDPANVASLKVCTALAYHPAGRQFSCYASLPPLTPSRVAPWRR